MAEEGTSTRQYIIFAFSITCLVLFGGLALWFLFSWLTRLRNPEKSGAPFPGEGHLPGGYNYCGPGTHYDARRRRGDQPINDIDRCCMEHDRRFGTHETTRAADTGLVMCVAKAKTNGWRERVDRGVTLRAMGAKMRLEDNGMLDPGAYRVGAGKT